MKIITIGVVALILLTAGIYGISKYTTIFVDTPDAPVVTPKKVDTPTPSTTTTVTPTKPATTTPAQNEKSTHIGDSVEERPITAYHYGTGATEILFVGGMHGGYSWNTAKVAYELMTYLEANPTAIPKNVRVTVIPVLNPDGLLKVYTDTTSFTPISRTLTETTKIASRFNAQNVDLNRNFDCDWQSKGTWQSREVSGGSKVFSEPESQALRDYVNSHTIAGAVVWYSAAGGVYASTCHSDILAKTSDMVQTYAKASEYPAHESFDYYEITGDAVNWLAKNNIPAISILLTTHDNTEWEKNKAGIIALLNSFTE